MLIAIVLSGLHIPGRKQPVLSKSSQNWSRRVPGRRDFVSEVLRHRRSCIVGPSNLTAQVAGAASTADLSCMSALVQQSTVQDCWFGNCLSERLIEERRP